MKPIGKPSPSSPPGNSKRVQPRAEQRPGAQRALRYYVLISCEDERRQVQLLERFLNEGLHCKALLG